MRIRGVLPKIVAVSGGFDPLHDGHVALIREAKSLGDDLWVILNNDNWVKAKKGYVFMPEEARAKILLAIRYVDRVFFTRHQPDDIDMTVCPELAMLKPDIFANGGDREGLEQEEALCQKLGIKTVYGVGGMKIRSSSQLVRDAVYFL